MSNKIPNRQAICEVLMKAAEQDKDIVALCSDSRGSASMTPFFQSFPEQAVEVGIAEQNLISIAAGMAKIGKKAYCFSPACFLSTRSYEQAKIDVCYSNTNVKLIGISGGISYGALGMSHHSAQDIACMSALPNMRVYLPSDRFQTAKLIEALLRDQKPAYVRVGRNPVEDIYDETLSFALDSAILHGEMQAQATIVACGEMVKPALSAQKLLMEKGIPTNVIDMYCVKPLDKELLAKAASSSRLVVTMEEHSPFGGLGSAVASFLSTTNPKRMLLLSLPDDHVITGKSQEVFDYYGLSGRGVAERVEAFFQG